MKHVSRIFCGWRTWRHLFALTFGLALTACNPTPDTRFTDISRTLVQPATGNPFLMGSVQNAVLIPAGTFSMVTARTRPDMVAGPLATPTNIPPPAAPDNGKPPVIVCSAPSPDWATAYALTQQAQGSGSSSGGPSVSLSASSSSTEAITAMLGRTAGVVALRDGLYKACEAYSNGVIGKDAYALVLSQYGNLLVALAGAGSGSSGGSGSSAATAPASPSGVAVAVSAGGTTSTPAGSTQQKPAEPAANTAILQMQQQVLQAMLVACISESDPTVRPKGERNAVLNTPSVCGSLLSQVAAKLPALLDPLTGTAPTASTDKSKIKTPPDPKIKALQQKLIGCGAHIEADGYWGALTLAAAEQYDCGGAAPPPGEK